MVSVVLAGVCFAVALSFAYRSFYGMRIGTYAIRSHGKLAGVGLPGEAIGNSVDATGT
jgi:hypothetical protein